MSHIYDNWERLVDAVLKKEHFWQLAHDKSRTPTTISSDASNFSRSLMDDVDIDFRSHTTCGSVYKFVTYTTHMTFVVKKLTSGIISELDFKRTMDIVGNVKHENVVALRAYRCSKYENLMLYDHYSEGVCELLHGKNGEERALVDWETRMRIAIGAAKGIAEIHTQNGGKFVHGNIKASNIFINSKQFGSISDLGFASIIAKSFLPDTWHYAPEVGYTRIISQASDVYSFGVFLLELLTRKSEWSAKVFDADLLKHPEIKDQMVKLMRIGIRCVENSPKKRSIMSVLLKKLEEISCTRKVNPSIFPIPFFPFNTKKKVNSATSGRNQEFVHNHNTITPALVERKLVFVQDDNATFDLEDLRGSSAERLHRGTYKAFLKVGNKVMVKRLMDMKVTCEEFQQHVESIGRMRHRNVVKLRAYCNSEDLKFLLCDYCNQGNLSSTPLGWPVRLRIAVGAAKGIAYIHRQNGGTIVHGNIKSTNIFLNEKQYGVVSDFGMQKFTDRVGPSSYWAPEVSNTGRVSQASDVFSFGVVLLELVTGKDCWVVYLVDWIRFVLLLRNGKVSGTELRQSRKEKDDEAAMVKLLEIGLNCIVPVPEQRPKMAWVVKMLLGISEVYKIGTYDGSYVNVGVISVSISSMAWAAWPWIIIDV